MSRRTATGTATPQATAQSGKELREELLVVWERTVANRASSFYEAGIIESVDEGGESRRVHLAVLAPPPPPQTLYFHRCASLRTSSTVVFSTKAFRAIAARFMENGSTTDPSNFRNHSSRAQLPERGAHAKYPAGSFFSPSKIPSHSPAGGGGCFLYFRQLKSSASCIRLD